MLRLSASRKCRGLGGVPFEANNDFVAGITGLSRKLNYSSQSSYLTLVALHSVKTFYHAAVFRQSSRYTNGTVEFQKQLKLT